MEPATVKRPIVRTNRVKENVVVKYIEHNGNEQETWCNYYIFDYKPKLIKQFEVMERFLIVFDKQSKVEFNLAVRNHPFLTLRRTHFDLRMHRKSKDDQNSLMNLQREAHSTKHGYKSSHFYRFSGTDLPHYREIAALLKKHKIPDDEELFNIKLKQLLQNCSPNDDREGVYHVVERLFYKKFGDYKEEYGEANKVFDSESEND